MTEMASAAVSDAAVSDAAVSDEAASGLPFFPMERDARCPFDEPPAYRRLREQEPISRAVLWNGRKVWVFARYEDQRTILTDPRFSADLRRPGYPLLNTQAAVLEGGGARSFVFLDDPEHDRVRRSLIKEFTVKRIEALRPRIEQIVDGALDAMLAGPKPADLVKALAMPVPSVVICEMLGVPYADHEFFQEVNEHIVSREVNSGTVRDGHQELNEYLVKLVDSKREQPGDDMISRLLRDQVDEGRMTLEELPINLLLLLLAGQEPTTDMIGIGTAVLLQHPEQFAELGTTQDPKFVAGAVEEILRYASINHVGIRRVAAADVEIGGQLIRAGEGVVLVTDSAARDEEVFDDAAQPDVHRGARNHLAFGYGVHQCIGQTLSRVELQTVFRALARRVPTLRLAVPLDEVPFRHDMNIYGVHSLPVTW
jgi:cytochrome P450